MAAIKGMISRRGFRVLDRFMGFISRILFSSSWLADSARLKRIQAGVRRIFIRTWFAAELPRPLTHRRQGWYHANAGGEKTPCEESPKSNVQSPKSGCSRS